ncbi:MAG: hydantoinase/oxoprolinase family protein [Actinobacteria bacterium]|nr:hydantoinase/oxoprolinase family protein [Actinomycetota bacterium]
MNPSTILAVDVGGTFTDAVLIADGHVFSGKTPTTPDDQSLGVITAARQALGAADVRPNDVEAFVHGMTVTTNALLEGRFARTALLATKGFTDIEELGRQNRPDLYKLCKNRPAPIVPDNLRLPVAERCGPDGVIEPLDEDSVRAALKRCREAKVESIAVCLLFSFRHPAHELRIAEIAHEVMPTVHVSLSHEAVGTFREYERCATTIADAALSPLLAGYLARLRERAATEGLPAPDVMLSNGGSAAAELAARNAAATVLSGPAGGAVGTARAAARAGAPRALGFDMGGTSTDVSLVHDGLVSVSASREIAGRPVALPSIDILTVGAGGGSIAWRDDGGALRVGPRSAGARPGPACYGLGGAEPTVTDANLLLGRLGADSALAGGLRLNTAAAERAVGALADDLGLDIQATAEGIVRIANLEMLRATNAATVARGVDPRDHVLVAFGGAGPMHAVAIAEALGIGKVICPHACGVLSARGMAAAGRRRDRSRSVVRNLQNLDDDTISQIVDELREAAAADLADPPEARVEATFELRYVGQAHELAVRLDPAEAAAASIERAFHDAHQRSYGFSERTAPVELVTVRVSVEIGGERGDGAETAAPRSPGAGDEGATLPPATRTAWFGGKPYDTSVVRLPRTGDAFPGPAVIELPEATVVVPPGWTASITPHADVSLDRRAGAAGNSA